MATSARSFGLSLSLCLAVAFNAAAAAPPASAEEKPHKPYAIWVVGKGEKNGQPVMVRWRDKMPDVDFKAAHPWCVEITWTFKHDATGKVPREEIDRATDLDTALEQELDGETATEVAGFSTDEKRVWIVYANDRYNVEAALDTMKRDDPTLPITYESHRDADWQGLALVLGTVKE